MAIKIPSYVDLGTFIYTTLIGFAFGNIFTAFSSSDQSSFWLGTLHLGCALLLCMIQGNYEALKKRFFQHRSSSRSRWGKLQKQLDTAQVTVTELRTQSKTKDGAIKKLKVSVLDLNAQIYELQADAEFLPLPVHSPGSVGSESSRETVKLHPSPLSKNRTRRSIIAPAASLEDEAYEDEGSSMFKDLTIDNLKAQIKNLEAQNTHMVADLRLLGVGNPLVVPRTPGYQLKKNERFENDPEEALAQAQLEKEGFNTKIGQLRRENDEEALTHKEELFAANTTITTQATDIDGLIDANHTLQDEVDRLKAVEEQHRRCAELAENHTAMQRTHEESRIMTEATFKAQATSNAELMLDNQALRNENKRLLAVEKVHKKCSNSSALESCCKDNDRLIEEIEILKTRVSNATIDSNGSSVGLQSERSESRPEDKRTLDGRRVGNTIVVVDVEGVPRDITEEDIREFYQGREEAQTQLETAITEIDRRHVVNSERETEVQRLTAENERLDRLLDQRVNELLTIRNERNRLHGVKAELEAQQEPNDGSKEPQKQATDPHLGSQLAALRDAHTQQMTVVRQECQTLLTDTESAHNDFVSNLRLQHQTALQNVEVASNVRLGEARQQHQEQTLRMRTELKSLQARSREVTNSEEALRDVINQRDQLLTERTMAIANLSSDLAEAQVAVEKVQSTIATKDAELSESRDKAADVENQLQSKVKELKDARRLVQIADQLRTDLSKDLKVAKEVIETERKARTDETNRWVESMRDAVQREKTRFAKLKTEYKELKKNSDLNSEDREKELAQLEETVSELEDRVDQLEKEFSGIKVSLDQAEVPPNDSVSDRVSGALRASRVGSVFRSFLDEHTNRGNKSLLRHSKDVCDDLSNILDFITVSKEAALIVASPGQHGDGDEEDILITLHKIVEDYFANTDNQTELTKFCKDVESKDPSAFRDGRNRSVSSHLSVFMQGHDQMLGEITSIAYKLRESNLLTQGDLVSDLVVRIIQRYISSGLMNSYVEEEQQLLVLRQEEAVQRDAERQQRQQQLEQRLRASQQDQEEPVEEEQYKMGQDESDGTGTDSRNSADAFSDSSMGGQ